ncbi:DUF4224 domain-containing protein [Citrobacter werkmanii]|uniref:DUF4224 domain-containing protein n=1 Tax=Citrobacter werkmanii TaxID=67827 RepID=UPI00388FEE11
MADFTERHAFNTIISDADLEELTGYSSPSRQGAVLKAYGIFFITRRDGRPRTTWEHFNNPLSHRHIATVPDAIEPNFAALD